MYRLRSLFRALFGEFNWAAPGWLRRIGASFVALNRFRRDQARRFWSGLVASLILVSAITGGWLWYRSRPLPNYVAWSLREPEATALSGDDAGKVKPLTITFSASAAPLDQIGKTVSSGIVTEPPIKGSWTWDNESTLALRPEADWDIGRQHKVTLAASLLAPHVRLENYAATFSTPKFRQASTHIEFYEDPTDSKIKRVVATVEFSHPVSKADFERRIALRMVVDPVDDFADARATSFGFKVSYDDAGGKAYIHSDVVAIPDRDGKMQLAIAPGVVSSRGGPGTGDTLTDTVTIPGIERYFQIEAPTLRVVTNDRHEMERVLEITTTAAVTTAALRDATEVWQLPVNRPAIGDEPAQENYQWWGVREIVPEVLALAKKVDLDWLPSDAAYSKSQMARLSAPAGSFLFVRVRRGLRSFGDYPLVNDFTGVLDVVDFPKQVKILYDGSLLSLSGDKKLSLLTRNLDGIRIALSRLTPNSVAHLLSQSSADTPFQRPGLANGSDEYDWPQFSLANIAEVFTEERAVPRGAPGSAQYTAFDFSSFVRPDDPPRGLFVLAVNAWDPNRKTSDLTAQDERLVLVTDLGLLVKDLEDGSHEVFVQSVRTGRPVAGARVDILGKNGVAALSQVTDANGQVHFPKLTDLKREKTPVAYVAQLSGDYTFLPYGRRDRKLDLSRSDTGGVYAEAVERGLSAYLFSDRGIYRPGEDVRVGVILRRLDWQPLPDGLPLEIAITDPRGVEIRRDKVKFGADGLLPITFTTQPSSPTGSYQVTLYVGDDNIARTLLGSVRVKVEEFSPDQLSLRAELSAAPRAGWISPDKLACSFALKNLFGTPSIGGTVKAQLQLSGWYPSFAGFADFSFFDPSAAKKNYDETLAELTTNDSGQANVDLQLERFEHATFRLVVKAEATGPDKGRSVAATVNAVVSPLPYLIGWKADGDLNFIHRDSRRAIEMIAVDPDLQRTDVTDLKAEWLSITYASVLTKQPNGTLAYQSVRRETITRTEPLKVTASGTKLPLPTDVPGSYELVIRDNAGTELNRVRYDVVGEANTSRNLERSGELRIKLERSDYAAGEDIEVAIQAPYAGAGLITIERDRVYASKWFRTTANSTVEHITVPADLEGNGYVVVSFVRALDSPEVFTSPLSSGAVPFSVSRTRRTQPVDLDVPAKIEPGQTLRIGYQTGQPAKILVWAVDEGILQVSRYRTPSPLDHFFRKRALEVDTFQILDLILPEYSVAEALAAPGGDDDALAFGAKNPFKRKGLPPVAYWSGVIDTDGTKGEVHYEVPDHFNGTLRVIAMAVTPERIGVAERSTLVRGPLVIEPTAPYAVVPGDEFEATALVANTGEDPALGQDATLSLSSSDGLEVVGDATRPLVVPAGREVSVSFRVRVSAKLGPASLTFRAGNGARTTKSTVELSIRPASPFITTVSSGRIDGGGGHADLPVTRQLYDSERDVDAVASYVPAALTRGLARYLERYDYACTEQVVSRAFAALMLKSQPELGGSAPEKVDAVLQRAFATLQARQGVDGDFGLFSASDVAPRIVSVYATHLLIESRERGVEVPESLYRRAIAGLEASVVRPGAMLYDERAQAYAIYLLARTGRVTTSALNSLRERAELYNKNLWRRDLMAMFMAATASQLNLEDEAETLRRGVGVDVIEPDLEHYHDALVHRGWMLYLAAKHFPVATAKLPGGDLDALADAIAAGRYHSMSSAILLLAFDALGQATTSATSTPPRIAALAEGGKVQPLEAIGLRFPHAKVPATAKAARFATEARQTLFYQLVEAGYDATLPTQPIARKLEVVRELKDQQGHDVTKVTPLAAVEVHVVVRATEGGPYDVALVDLLPGGFEIDMSPGGITDGASLPTNINSPVWTPRYVEVREDRVVFYGLADGTARRFVYRIKPLNRGVYTLPPLYAEGMYDHGAQARSLAGHIEVAE